MWKKMKKILKKIIKLPFNIVKGITKGVVKVIKMIINFVSDIVRAFGRMIVLIVKSPLLLSIQSYKKAIIIRDWLIVKIDYLDSESAKWHKFFKALALPYNGLLKLGFSPQMAASFLIAGSTVGTGVVVNETILAERSFSNRDAGVYLAPSNMPNSELEEQLQEEVTLNTLRVVLNDTPVEKIDISDVNLGTSYASNGQPSALPSGQTTAILVDGNNTRIEIGKLTVSRVSCKTLDMTDINANKISVLNNQADGLSIYQAATSSIPNLRVSGGNYMADLLQTSGGLYDRLHIAPLDSISSSKVYVNELNLTNIVSSGGACTFKGLDVGELELSFSRIAGDSSLVTKALTISSTVLSANWDVSGNIEVLMGEVARKPN
tara:strand:+ start:147 stop:1277 length:1131 start_codon:yes stop_codon:yes gene_type:complete